MRPLHHPTRSEIKFSAVMYALSDPTRLEIIRRLISQDELSCNALEIPVPKSSLSHHLKVLRESGVTFTRIEGTHRFISLRKDDLEARFPGLVQVVAAASEPF